MNTTNPTNARNATSTTNAKKAAALVGGAGVFVTVLAGVAWAQPIRSDRPFDTRYREPLPQPPRPLSIAVSVLDPGDGSRAQGFVDGLGRWLTESPQVKMEFADGPLNAGAVATQVTQLAAQKFDAIVVVLDGATPDPALREAFDAAVRSGKHVLVVGATAPVEAEAGAGGADAGGAGKPSGAHVTWIGTGWRGAGEAAGTFVKERLGRRSRSAGLWAHTGGASWSGAEAWAGVIAGMDAAMAGTSVRAAPEPGAPPTGSTPVGEAGASAEARDPAARLLSAVGEGQPLRAVLADDAAALERARLVVERESRARDVVWVLVGDGVGDDAAAIDALRTGRADAVVGAPDGALEAARLLRGISERRASPVSVNASALVLTKEMLERAERERK